MRIAVLALQGAFLEHEQVLERLGVDYFEVRQRADWEQSKDGIIIPGGESTTQGKLLSDLGLMAPIRNSIMKEQLPVFGTCAGLILLAKKIEGNASDSMVNTHLAMMSITASRNAYGRQLGSFHTESTFKGITSPIPMTFIRAPYIREWNNEVEVLATVDGRVVAAKQDNQLVTAFHPELDADTRVHEFFLKMI